MSGPRWALPLPGCRLRRSPAQSGSIRPDPGVLSVAPPGPGRSSVPHRYPVPAPQAVGGAVLVAPTAAAAQRRRPGGGDQGPAGGGQSVALQGWVGNARARHGEETATLETEGFQCRHSNVGRMMGV